jgi:hypothetical protein
MATVIGMEASFGLIAPAAPFTMDGTTGARAGVEVQAGIVVPDEATRIRPRTTTMCRPIARCSRILIIRPLPARSIGMLPPQIP